MRSLPRGVYAVVRDVRRYSDWWDEVSSVEILEPVNGRFRFRQHTSSGPIVMEIVEDIPSSRLVTRIADPDQPFGGSWTFEVNPTAGGSQLTITERGEVYNPVFRFMARFVFGSTGTIDSYVRALGSGFGEDATIE